MNAMTQVHVLAARDALTAKAPTNVFKVYSKYNINKCKGKIF